MNEGESLTHKITTWIVRLSFIVSIILVGKLDINNNIKSTGDNFGGAGFTVAGMALNFSPAGGFMITLLRGLAPGMSAMFNYDAVTKEQRQAEAKQQHNDYINNKIKNIESEIKKERSKLKTTQQISDCRMDIIDGKKVDYCDSNQMKEDNQIVLENIRRLEDNKRLLSVRLFEVDKAAVEKTEFDEVKEIAVAVSLPPLLSGLTFCLAVSFGVKTPRKKRKLWKIGRKTFENLRKRNENSEKLENSKKLSLQEKNNLDDLYHEMVKANGGEILKKRLWEAAKENKIVGRYEKIREYWPTRKKIEITERPINVTKIETWRKQ